MNEKCKMKRAAFEEWKIKKHNVDVDILISNQVQSVCSALLFSAVAFSFWNLLWYDFCACFCCAPLPHQAQLRDKRNFLCFIFFRAIVPFFVEFFWTVALDLRVEFAFLLWLWQIILHTALGCIWKESNGWWIQQSLHNARDGKNVA